MKEVLERMQKELIDMYRKVNKNANENVEIKRMKVEEPKYEATSIKKSGMLVSKLELSIF